MAPLYQLIQIGQDVVEAQEGASFSVLDTEKGTNLYRADLINETVRIVRECERRGCTLAQILKEARKLLYKPQLYSNERR